jgi:type I restriction enzyme S subunit
MPNKYLSARKGENELPDGWTWTSVGEITTPVEKVKPREQPDSDFIYLDISSINNSKNKITEPKNYIGADAPSRARQLVHTNDVLFSTVRTYLKNIALVPEIYDGQIASTGFSVLRCRDGVSPKFLFYYTLTDDFISALSNVQRGTSYPAVRDSDVREQIIPLAPFNEQKRIVAKMEELFSQL